MANAIFSWLVDAASPLITWANDLFTQALGAIIYDIALFGAAVFFGYWVKKDLAPGEMGVLTWILATTVLMGFFVSIGLGSP